MARLPGSRQASGDRKVRLPDQQWAGKPCLAERLPRPAKRIRDGPLALPIHSDEPGRREGAGAGGRRSRRSVQRQWRDPGHGLSDAGRTRRKQTFMLFAFPSGVQGNVVSAGVNEFIIPNYKQTWGNIRKIASAPAQLKGLASSPGNIQRLEVRTRRWTLGISRRASMSKSTRGAYFNSVWWGLTIWR